MGSRIKPTRILCANCNICVNTLRRYHALDQDTRVASLLASWVYPQIITEHDVVCEACRDLAMAADNHNLQQETVGNSDQQSGPNHRGHNHVCILCGCSIVQRQSDKILRENPTELHQSMIEIIKTRVAPRQVAASDRVCHACWLRIQREARRVSIVADAKSQHVAFVAEAAPEECQPQIQPQPESQKVVLPDYRRAVNSNNRCVFPHCISTTLHGISDKLRAIVLSNHKYYLPKLVCVCAEHLMSNSWDTLYESENSKETFTVDQIQHVFSFVNTFNQH